MKCSKPHPQPSYLPNTLPAKPPMEEQIKYSLKLNGYEPPSINWTAVFEVKSWDAFAKAVGTQDFSFVFLDAKIDGTTTTYIHYDYGLGDNDYGSVHSSQAVEAVIAVTDGDWHNRTTLPAGLINCLEMADSNTGNGPIPPQKTSLLGAHVVSAKSDCSVLGCAWAGGLCLEVGSACDTTACNDAYKAAFVLRGCKKTETR